MNNVTGIGLNDLKVKVLGDVTAEKGKDKSFMLFHTGEQVLWGASKRLTWKVPVLLKFATGYRDTGAK